MRYRKRQEADQHRGLLYRSGVLTRGQPGGRPKRAVSQSPPPRAGGLRGRAPRRARRGALGPPALADSIDPTIQEVVEAGEKCYPRQRGKRALVYYGPNVHFDFRGREQQTSQESIYRLMRTIRRERRPDLPA